MQINDIIVKSLEEDLGSGDVTTRYLELEPVLSSAYMIAKADGILAGIDIAVKVFKAVDPEIKVTLYRKDGDSVKPGDEILKVEGRPAGILQAERTALNFLQRMSGVATITRRMVDKISGTKARLLDTRKTTPLLRDLEKYAVRVGGGLNHRQGLFDMIMLKENHLRAAGGITTAVARIKSQNATYKIEVEVTNQEELAEAVAAKVDRVMLDNMSLKEIRASVKAYKNKIELEVSGGINEENILPYAKTGVHFISSGALTHSYKSLDISLLFKE